MEGELMGLPIYQVDSFAEKAFAGNPAGVCLLLNGERDTDWMQNVAMEMSLSETAFLCPQEDGWNLRWFTPTVEVDLCGHATLASAHVLFSQGLAEPEEIIKFHTLSGLLTARLNEDWIELDFPAEAAWAEEIDPGIIAALGVKPLFAGRNRIDYLVEVATEAEVLKLKPDLGRKWRLVMALSPVLRNFHSCQASPSAWRKAWRCISKPGWDWGRYLALIKVTPFSTPCSTATGLVLANSTE